MKFRQLLVVTAAVVSAAAFGTTPLHAGTVGNTTFTFTGSCTDCTPSGVQTVGILVLANYVEGNALTPSNFVTFDYSSNLIASFHIDSGSLTFISGSLPVGLGPATVTISSGTNFFGTSSNGNWCLSNTGGCADFGVNGTFTSGDTVVPEPAAYSLLLAGIAGIALVRRKRQA